MWLPPKCNTYFLNIFFGFEEQLKAGKMRNPPKRPSPSPSLGSQSPGCWDSSPWQWDSGLSPLSPHSPLRRSKPEPESSPHRAGLARPRCEQLCRFWPTLEAVLSSIPGVRAQLWSRPGGGQEDQGTPVPGAGQGRQVFLQRTGSLGNTVAVTLGSSSH